MVAEFQEMDIHKGRADRFDCFLTEDINENALHDDLLVAAAASFILHLPRQGESDVILNTNAGGLIAGQKSGKNRS